MRIRRFGFLVCLLSTLVAACTAGGGPRLPSDRVVPMLFKAEQLLEKGETCSGLLILVEVRETADEPGDRAQASTRLLEASQGDESLPLLASCGIRSRVMALMDTARSGEIEQVTLRLRSTVGWGCPCPPLVFVESGDVATFDEEMLYPVFKVDADYDRVWEPRGTYVVTGRMRSQPLDYYNWSEQIGRPVPLGKGDGEEYRLKRHPVFEVDSWCFTPDSDAGDAAAPDEGQPMVPAHICPQK